MTLYRCLWDALLEENTESVVDGGVFQSINFYRTIQIKLLLLYYKTGWQCLDKTRYSGCNRAQKIDWLISFQVIQDCIKDSHLQYIQRHRQKAIERHNNQIWANKSKKKVPYILFYISVFVSQCKWFLFFTEINYSRNGNS